ncbi:ATP-binding protein [Nonomuraea sp. SYSU D8015]|uniref:ATP-binding protein n=1 Tax=Nonomuraea sp. SYSU D8015 TaxID=2593644 RepID=UPI0016611142|nr:ATP-binding protein [Nonomuraea sp. SYSU D8015]
MSSGNDLLGRRLQAARERAFVGREEELKVFGSALRGACSVLYVHGPGGVGKSTLLRRFAHDAEAAGRRVTTLDGRTMDPSPGTLETEAGPVLRDERAVLLIDAFERVQGLEGWLRERFLPRLPVGALVVVAGRNPPDMLWTADPAWTGALRVMPLRDLDPADAAALLDVRGVLRDLRDPLLAFAGGHPLALSLGAAVALKDRTASARWTPSQDVVATLLDQLVGEVPSPAHQRALEVCAHAYMTTEDLLRAVLPDEDAGSLFDWLRRLPFVESSPRGLFPHDVVRGVLEADLRWRDPRGYADMHKSISDHLAAQIRGATDPCVLGAVGSLFFLHREVGSTAEFNSWRGDGEAYEDAFRPEDAETMVKLAAEVAGEESAATVAFWTARQPEAFRLYRRTETGELVGFCSWLRLDPPSEEEAAADPIVATAWANARAIAPLRPGEHLAVGRTWVLEQYQGMSPVMDLMQWRSVGYCLRDDRMAWSFMAMRSDDPMRDYLRHYDMHDLGEHAWVGDVEYALFAHDWRAVPAQAWLDRLNRLLTGSGQEDSAVPAPALAVLSRREFADAVRKALRHLSSPGELAASPLARSRLVTEQPGSDPAEVLRALLEQAVDEVGKDPRAEKFHRALAVTFLRGAPTQEIAAERLGLPFTTYRRHLAAGVERVSEDFWHRELYGTIGR